MGNSWIISWALDYTKTGNMLVQNLEQWLTHVARRAFWWPPEMNYDLELTSIHFSPPSQHRTFQSMYCMTSEDCSMLKTTPFRSPLLLLYSAMLHYKLLVLRHKKIPTWTNCSEQSSHAAAWLCKILRNSHFAKIGFNQATEHSVSTLWNERPLNFCTFLLLSAHSLPFQWVPQSVVLRPYNRLTWLHLYLHLLTYWDNLLDLVSSRQIVNLAHVFSRIRKEIEFLDLEDGSALVETVLVAWNGSKISH